MNKVQGVGVVILVAIIVTWIAYAVQSDRSVKSGMTWEHYRIVKEMSEKLDRQRAEILVREERMAASRAVFNGQKDWPLAVHAQHQTWTAEIERIKADYNRQAEVYNSYVKGSGYAFSDVGKLPAGMTQPLPREYKLYVEAK